MNAPSAPIPTKSASVPHPTVTRVREPASVSQRRTPRGWAEQHPLHLQRQAPWPKLSATPQQDWLLRKGSATPHDHRDASTRSRSRRYPATMSMCLRSRRGGPHSPSEPPTPSPPGPPPTPPLLPLPPTHQTPTSHTPPHTPISPLPP